MGNLPDNGKFLGQTGLNELVSLIKTKDARQIEKIKIDSSDLTMTTGEDGYNRVTLPNAAAPSTEGGTDGHSGLMTAADKWKLDHSEAAAIAGIDFNGTVLDKNDDNDVILTIKQNGEVLEVDTDDKFIDIVADENLIESISIGGAALTIDANKDVALPAVVASVEGAGGTNGLMIAADKEKLDGIEEGAEVNIIEVVKQNGTALTVTDADRSVDVSVPIMSLASSLDGTETAITPDSNYKAVVDLSALIPRSKIQSDFSQTITATDTVAQAKAIKEYVDSKAHISFRIVDNDTTKDVYYVEDSTTHVRTIMKQDSFIPESSTIYLVPEYGSRGGHAEYFWDAANANFELMGRTDVDLSDYVKYTDVTAFSTQEVDNIWNAN